MESLKKERYVKYTANNDFVVEFWGYLFNGKLEYSTDGVRWSEAAKDQETTVWSNNGTLYVRGEGNSFCVGLRGPIRQKCKYKPGTKITVSGSLDALLNYKIDMDKEKYDEEYMYDYISDFTFQSFFSFFPIVDASRLVLPEKMREGSLCDLFFGCTDLIVPPRLPAKNLEKYCYSGMFTFCTSLEKAPELPAEVMKYECYSGMFQYCKNLKTLPKIAAKVLEDGCFFGMFSDCENLRISADKDSEYNIPFVMPETGKTPSENVFFGMFDNTGGPFTGTPAGGRTYYLANKK